MNFVDAIKICFHKYADFTGRAGRPEFWYFALFIFIIEAVLFNVSRPLWAVFALAVLLPRLAVGTRRLHDTDRLGLWLLIAFVPVVGAIVLIVWFCQKSDAAANRFGAPPLPQGALGADT
jgi:uncharacterized membrane protein YhaH (DUF805 family)